MKHLGQTPDGRRITQHHGHTVTETASERDARHAAEKAEAVTNASSDLLEALLSSNCPHTIHSTAHTTDIEKLRRIVLWYSNWWNHKAMPAIIKAGYDPSDTRSREQEINAALAALQTADDNWSAQLHLKFSKDAGDKRYVMEGQGAEGSALRMAYDAYLSARRYHAALRDGRI